MARDVLKGHYPHCPMRTDPLEPCVCEEAEDKFISTASMPSPADLIRRARQQGLIQAGNAYA